MAILRELFLSTAPVAGDRVRVDKLLRVILKIILVAALVTMPLYIVGEEFTLSHLWRVLAINGGTALSTMALLQLARLGRTRIVSAVLVWGLFALISYLAATTGERVHVNVVNFVLVLVLASLLLRPRDGLLILISCLLVMIAIAYRQSLSGAAIDQNERFVETMVQFIPQFLIIALLLRVFAAISGSGSSALPPKNHRSESRADDPADA
jgi:hypothetical protein